MTLPGRVVVLSTDLMDRSRFDPLRGLGTDVAVVRRAADVAAALAAVDGDGRVVLVVDLSRPDAIEAIGVGTGAVVDVVAYGSHVDREDLDRARAVGARVYARSAFFSRLVDAVQ